MMLYLYVIAVIVSCYMITAQTIRGYVGQTVNFDTDYTPGPDEDGYYYDWRRGPKYVAGISRGGAFSFPLEYSGRVTVYGRYGFSLHNVPTADDGIYTFYAVDRGHRKYSKQSHQLIVSDIDPNCSCKIVSSASEEDNGNNYTVTNSTCLPKINSTDCCADSANCVPGAFVHKCTQHNNTACEITLLIDFTPQSTTPRLQLDGVGNTTQLDTITNQHRDAPIMINTIFTQLDAIVNQQGNFTVAINIMGAQLDAIATQQHSPDLSIITAAVIYIAVISVVNTVMIIIALLFIIRGNRAVLSQLNKKNTARSRCVNFAQRR